MCSHYIECYKIYFYLCRLFCSDEYFKVNDDDNEVLTAVKLTENKSFEDVVDCCHTLVPAMSFLNPYEWENIVDNHYIHVSVVFC